MTFLLQLQTNSELNINKVKKTLSNNKIKSIKVSNSELYCFANLSLNEIKLILVNNINSNENVHLYEYTKKTMIKVQLSIINNEQMNKTNTKFNTWQSYCKYLDEKIDKVEIRLNAKIDEIKDQVSEIKEQIWIILKEIKDLKNKI
ncbi:MAG: hypothetical protein LBS95_01605 [Mycoplasmataceae bacterium]|jgi:DNA-binding transcriptional MerR regulator|nr:hypothetical protein [Mycoplasmataceae bacterium]